MSLPASPGDIIAEQTMQVARAAFPKGNPYIRMRDASALSLRTRPLPRSFRIPDARRKPQPNLRS
jgi:hypothetical protein